MNAPTGCCNTSRTTSSGYHPSSWNTPVSRSTISVTPCSRPPASKGWNILQQLRAGNCHPPRQYTTRWLSKSNADRSSELISLHTLVKMFAPREKPMPYSLLFGHLLLHHLTICRQSHVARALYSTGVVILLIAQPREFTTHAAQPASMSGLSTARRYISCEALATLRCYTATTTALMSSKTPKWRDVEVLDQKSSRE